jgi:glutathione peroxidase
MSVDMTHILSQSVTRSNGTVTTLQEFAGKSLLIVNTASQCGYTPQYQGLEALYQKYRDRGLVILGFPCNQFGGQEPGTNEEIVEFCTINYKISFPLFSKIDVNGERAHPLYQYLTDNAPGLLGTKKIKWNFTKFFVSKDGTVIRRFAPQDTPEKVEKIILPYL